MYDLILDYNSLLNDVMITNATYLGISVLVVLALGGISGAAVYFISIKPYQIKISETADELTFLRTEIETLVAKNEHIAAELDKKYIEIESQYSELKEAAEKQQLENEEKLSKLEIDLQSSADALKTEIENQIKKIDEKIISSEILNDYREHWVWDSRDVPINTIRSLVIALHKTIINNSSVWLQKLILDEMEFVLSRNLEKLKEDSDIQDILENIKELLPKVDKKYSEQRKLVEEELKNFTS